MTHNHTLLLPGRSAALLSCARDPCQAACISLPAVGPAAERQRYASMDAWW
jgi:hypothetical protein